MKPIKNASDEIRTILEEMERDEELMDSLRKAEILDLIHATDSDDMTYYMNSNGYSKEQLDWIKGKGGAWLRAKEWLLNRRRKFIVTGTKAVWENKRYITVLQASAAQLGFILDADLVEAFRSLDKDSFQRQSKELMAMLEGEKGADVDQSNYLFPDFPYQCRQTPLQEISNLRFAGYLADFLGWYVGDPHFRRILGLGKYAQHTDRTPLELDLEEMEHVSLGKVDTFYEMCCNLLGSRMALSVFDRNCLAEILYRGDIEIEKMIPREIPFKENWAYLIRINKDILLPISFHFKSFYDVKRAYAAMIDGDITLKTNFGLHNLKNQQRKWLMEQMEAGMQHYEESFRESACREQAFVVLLWNRIHPENYRSVAPRSVALLKEIKGGVTVKTQRAMVEIALAEGKVLEAVKLASQNPGDAIRRLAHILSVARPDEVDEILETIENVAVSVDTTVLLNAKCALEEAKEKQVKICFPQGQVSKVYVYQDTKQGILEETKEKAVCVLEKVIKRRLSTKPKLGSVYIDPVISKLNIPFSTRNDTKGLRLMARGSRMSVSSDAEVLRFFVYKKIKQGGFVDLSLLFLNETFHIVDQCSWTNLKTSAESPVALHSGDSAACEEGLSEFIDVDLNVLKRRKEVRYVMMDVLSYNFIPFCNMDRCFAGLMVRKGMMTDQLPDGRNYSCLTREERQKVKDFYGEVFEPSTVQYRTDLIANEWMAYPLLYDTKENEIIWMDLSFSRKPQIFPNYSSKHKTVGNVIPYGGTLSVENLNTELSKLCFASVHMKRPRIYELIELNVKARGGQLVEKREEADFVVAEDGDLSPFHTDILLKDWL